MVKLDQALFDIEITAITHIREKLLSLESKIKILIQERDKRVSGFKGAREIVEGFFGEILQLVQALLKKSEAKNISMKSS